MRPAPIFATLALLLAVVGGVLVARTLLEGKAVTPRIPCPPAAHWIDHGDAVPASYPLREHRIMLGINGFRRAHGLRLLRSSDALARAARAHSLDMLRKGYFAHDSPGGSFVQRLARYTPSSCIAEVLAWGVGSYGTARGVVAAWERSPEHRRVLLLSWIRSVGVGVRTGRFQGAAGASVATADFSG